MLGQNKKSKGYYLDSDNKARCDEESLSKFLDFFDSAFHRHTTWGHTLCFLSGLIKDGELSRYETGTDEYSIEIDQDGFTISNDYVDDPPMKCSHDELWNAMMQWELILKERDRRELKQEIRDKAPYVGFACGAFVGLSLAFVGTFVLILLISGLF